MGGQVELVTQLGLVKYEAHGGGVDGDKRLGRLLEFGQLLGAATPGGVFPAGKPEVDRRALHRARLWRRRLAIGLHGLAHDAPVPRAAARLVDLPRPQPLRRTQLRARWAEVHGAGVEHRQPLQLWQVERLEVPLGHLVWVGIHQRCVQRLVFKERERRPYVERALELAVHKEAVGRVEQGLGLRQGLRVLGSVLEQLLPLGVALAARELKLAVFTDDGADLAAEGGELLVGVLSPRGVGTNARDRAAHLLALFGVPDHLLHVAVGGLKHMRDGRRQSSLGSGEQAAREVADGGVRLAHGYHVA